MKNNTFLPLYENALSEYKNNPQKRRNFFHLQWHITDRCNLQCRHCYSDYQNIRDLQLQDLKEIFDKYLKTIQKWRIRGEISLTGGEPLLRKDLFELLIYIYEKWKENPCFQVGLMSNGTCISEEIVSQLKSFFPMISTIQISMDGTEKKIHEELRGKNTFDKAKNSFYTLHKNGFDTALHFVVHKNNFRDAFNILKLGAELNGRRVTISRLVNEGRGKDIEMLSPSELKELWVHLSRECLDFYSQGVILARSRCDLWHLGDIGSALFSLKWIAQKHEYPHYFQIGQRCPIGLNGLVVDTDGTVFPCRRLPISLGNIKEDTFFNIWYGSGLLWKFRYRERYMKGKCRDCIFLIDEELRFLCCGGSPCISYGNFDDCFMSDPQCWFDPYDDEQIEEVIQWKKNVLEQGKTFSS